ncbi:alkyl sulfatase dimerization domain-containing protein [Paracoccus sp. (in: a-proteobacteria)]|uniref:alkyl sulfatase dimerization domain-containing protein n=1 Tax=Paracoccus sp. TaxID=267 RepID=UPI0035B0D79D
MTTRRRFMGSVPAAGAALALAGTQRAGAQTAPAGLDGWHSPSLTEATVTAPNRAVTTQVAIDVNARHGTLGKSAARVAEGVWLLSGWGLGHSMAVEAPQGWIVVDTGDSTATAADMRAHLEQAVGAPIRVAAILLTHWHYAEGTAAWMDEGTEIWGHEQLDANRAASTGVSIKSGFYQARAVAQFSVLHPTEGADAPPNMLGFTIEKLTGVSSYQAPTRLFEHGKVARYTIAGEEVEVGPNRSDTADSVGFHFPARRTLISNFMVPGFIFNVYSLRGGPFRNPLPFIEDLRWMESLGAEVLLDLHAAPVTGAGAVRDAIHRSSDQVQLIHDQTLRMIAQGMDGREAAENVYMPAHLRNGWEAYGQVESHVRQIYSGTVGWFGHDVYDINPLSLRDEAARTVAMMGGAEAVRAAANAAADEGGIANWQWALRLTSMLRALDPDDADARRARIIAARALGQRTTSSNARGWYITEALELEGGLLVAGRPVTLAMARAVLGTPDIDTLVAAPVEANLEFLRYLVDPRAAENKSAAFTLAVSDDPRTWMLELRNGVLVVSPSASPLPAHASMSRRDLAEFVLGLTSPDAGNAAMAEVSEVLDRSHFVHTADLGQALDEPQEQARVVAYGEH